MLPPLLDTARHELRLRCIHRTLKQAERGERSPGKEPGSGTRGVGLEARTYGTHADCYGSRACAEGWLVLRRAKKRMVDQIGQRRLLPIDLRL
jgi:hypothetical protein